MQVPEKKLEFGILQPNTALACQPKQTSGILLVAGAGAGAAARRSVRSQVFKKKNDQCDHTLHTCLLQSNARYSSSRRLCKTLCDQCKATGHGAEPAAQCEQCIMF